MAKEPIPHRITPDEILTVGPASRLAAVTAQTLKAWIDEGLLPAQRAVNGSRLVLKADLVAFLEARAQRRQKVTSNAA